MRSLLLWPDTAGRLRVMNRAQRDDVEPSSSKRVHGTMDCTTMLAQRCLRLGSWVAIPSRWLRYTRHEPEIPMIPFSFLTPNAHIPFLVLTFLTVASASMGRDVDLEAQ